MSHLRKEIRKAVQASLLNKTAADDRVFSNRAQVFFKTPMPAINVVTGPESNRDRAVVNHPNARGFTILIQIYDQISSDLDDVLDDLANEVEGVLAEAGAFGDVVDARLVGSVPDVTAVAEEPAGVVELTYSVTYLTP